MPLFKDPVPSNTLPKFPSDPATVEREDLSSIFNREEDENDGDDIEMDRDVTASSARLIDREAELSGDDAGSGDDEKEDDIKRDRKRWRKKSRKLDEKAREAKRIYRESGDAERDRADEKLRDWERTGFSMPVPNLPSADQDTSLVLLTTILTHGILACENDIERVLAGIPTVPTDASHHERITIVGSYATTIRDVLSMWCPHRIVRHGTNECSIADVEVLKKSLEEVLSVVSSTMTRINKIFSSVTVLKTATFGNRGNRVVLCAEEKPWWDFVAAFGTDARHDPRIRRVATLIPQIVAVARSHRMDREIRKRLDVPTTAMMSLLDKTVHLFEDMHQVFMVPDQFDRAPATGTIPMATRGMPITSALDIFRRSLTEDERDRCESVDLFGGLKRFLEACEPSIHEVALAKFPGIRLIAPHQVEIWNQGSQEPRLVTDAERTDQQRRRLERKAQFVAENGVTEELVAKFREEEQKRVDDFMTKAPKNTFMQTPQAALKSAGPGWLEARDFCLSEIPLPWISDEMRTECKPVPSKCASAVLALIVTKFQEFLLTKFRDSFLGENSHTEWLEAIERLTPAVLQSVAIFNPIKTFSGDFSLVIQAGKLQQLKMLLPSIGTIPIHEGAWLHKEFDEFVDAHPCDEPRAPSVRCIDFTKLFGHLCRELMKTPVLGDEEIAKIREVFTTATIKFCSVVIANQSNIFVHLSRAITFSRFRIVLFLSLQRPDLRDACLETLIRNRIDDHVAEQEKIRAADKKENDDDTD